MIRKSREHNEDELFSKNQKKVTGNPEGERRENDEDEKARESKVANLLHRFLERFVTNGLKVDLIKPGRIVCSMKIPPHLLNAGNFLYGGATATLVDLIGSAVIYTAGVSVEKAAIEALLENLKKAALEPDLTPFPANRGMATLTPPIEGYLEKLMDTSKKSSSKEKLR